MRIVVERQVTLVRLVAVAWATVGVFVAIALALALGLQELLKSVQFMLLVGIGATACIAAAGWCGGRSASIFSSGSSVSAGFRGACIAVVALECGSLAGGIASLIRAIGGPFRLGNPLTYILGPAFWVSLYGLLPALVLGVAFGLVARRVIRRTSAAP